jgi:hypothetical protein
MKKKVSQWGQGMLCGLAAAMMPGAAILLVILLAPGLVVLLVDHQPGRPIGRAVIVCGLAGSVPSLHAAWTSGLGMDTAMAALGDMNAMGVAWLAAAAGWLLAELLPLGIRIGLDATSTARAVRLRAMRARLAADWRNEAA